MKIPRSLATYAFLAVITVSCESSSEIELAQIFGTDFLVGDDIALSRGADLSASEIQQLKSMLGTKKTWKNGFPALENKSPDALVQILGSPDFVREDGESQIWQYRSNDCILDIFIHGPEKNPKIIYTEIRARTLGRSPHNSCVTNLIIGKLKQKHALFVQKIKHRLRSKSS